MTEAERAKIEVFRKALKLDAPTSLDAKEYLEDFNQLFPPPKPPDPIEDCRAELVQYFVAGYYSSSKPLVDIMDIYNKHHPKKETKDD